MFETGKSAATIIDEQGLKQISDEGAIEPPSMRLSLQTLHRSKRPRKTRSSKAGLWGRS